MTVTKNTLAKSILYETGIPITMAQDILDSLFDIIIESSVKDGSAKIPKFGSFYVKDKKSRPGRNINTKEEVLIQARKVATFLPSNHLKQAVNE